MCWSRWNSLKLLLLGGGGGGREPSKEAETQTSPDSSLIQSRSRGSDAHCLVVLVLPPFSHHYKLRTEVMKLSRPILSVLTLPWASAYLVSPPGTSAPGTNADCSNWVQASYFLTCYIIERYYHLPPGQLEPWVSCSPSSSPSKRV